MKKEHIWRKRAVADTKMCLFRDFTFTFHFHALEKEMAPHSSVLAWRIPGAGSLVGCRLWGHTESDTPAFLPGESQGRRGLVAAISGAAQSRTRLKRLSSSNMFT